MEATGSATADEPDAVKLQLLMEMLNVPEAVAIALLAHSGGDVNVAASKHLDGDAGADGGEVEHKTHEPVAHGRRPPTQPSAAKSPSRPAKRTAGQASILRFFGSSPSKSIQSSQSPASTQSPVSSQEDVAPVRTCVPILPPPLLPAPAPAPTPTPTVLATGDTRAEATPAMLDQFQAALLQQAERFNPAEFITKFWQSGVVGVPFRHVAWTLHVVSRISGRNDTLHALTNSLRVVMTLHRTELVDVLALFGNALELLTNGAELRLGYAAISAAAQAVFASTKQRMTRLYEETGDVGDVIEACWKQQLLMVKPAPLTVARVRKLFLNIANCGGTGSHSMRKDALCHLFREADAIEAKYLARSIVRALRVGANMTLIVKAMTRAACLSQDVKQTEAGLKTAVETVERSYALCPDLSRIAGALLDGGVAAVKSTCVLTVGTPVEPMLATASTGIPDVFSTMAGRPFVCQYKYDGQRGQLHYQQGKGLFIFTRNLENCTAQFPDVCDAIRQMLQLLDVKPQNFVLDAEIVAVDRGPSGSECHIQPFQLLSTRARGTVAAEAVTVPVCVFVFDVMLWDDRLLSDEPLQTRMQLLTDVLPNMPGRFEVATSFTSKEEDDVESFLRQAIDNRVEGIIAKALSGGPTKAVYEPGKRADGWLKVKRDYVSELADSLDLVPIGAWYGNGRKAGWWSPVLLAAYNPDTDMFESVCRCMSGFSDEFYRALRSQFDPADPDLAWATPKPHNVLTHEQPAVWFKQCQVWEIRGAELSVSPVHMAASGTVHDSKGLSLRFPRFLRVRTDKAPTDATTSATLALMYRQHRARFESRPKPTAGNDDGSGSES